MAQFDSAIRRDANFADAHYMRGLVQRQQGDIAGAMTSLRLAVALRPESGDAQISLADTLGQAGDVTGAAVARETAARLAQRKSDSQASTFAVGVGRKRRTQQDLAGAVERFREAVRLAADNPHAHYQLALTLRQLGQLEEARRHFDEATRLAPFLRPPPLP